MNNIVKKHYKLYTDPLKKRVLKTRKSSKSLTAMLPYKPPYSWDEMLGFLSGRAIKCVEKTEDGRYMRTARVETRSGKTYSGWIKAENAEKKNALKVRVSGSLYPVLSKVLARVRDLFDLRNDPDTVYRTLCVMNELESGFCVKGRRLPGCFDPFEMAVRAVLGQQITVRAASVITGRVACELGEPVETDIEGLTRAFPTPERIVSLGDDVGERLGKLGVITTRSACIYSLASALIKGDIKLERGADPQKAVKELKSIKGIGDWTANYIVMRAIGCPDLFLETDAGIKHVLPGKSAKELSSLAEDWKPYRSYAVMNLWFKNMQPPAD